MMTRGLYALLLALVALPVAAAPARVETPRPNFVIFYTDDLGYGDTGVYGSPVIRTPNIDRFAAEGVRFTSFYAPAPNCSPSRAGLLTGRYPARVGLYDIVLNRESMMELPESELTVAELLKGAGYDTFHAGKWHLTPERGDVKNPALRHGFDYTTRGVQLAHDAVGHFTAYLDRRPDKHKPFFAYLAIPEPHEPVGQRVRPEFRALYDNATAIEAAHRLPDGGVPRNRVVWGNASAYFGVVTQIDDAFGKLLTYLDSHGLRENTLVLFASDNGPENRTRYSFGSAGPLRGAKGQVYEGGIRVPAILRYPGVAQPGTVVDEPINGVDLLPTLCALAGVSVPDDRAIDGVDFLPALRGQKLQRATPLYWSMWAGRGGMQYSMRDGNWKILAATNPLSPEVQVIDHIKNSRFVRFELYDLSNDLAESKNLAGSEPERLEALGRRFLALHEEVVADGPAFPLEEHRDKARAAFPGAKLPRTPKPAQDDEDDGEDGR